MLLQPCIVLLAALGCVVYPAWCNFAPCSRASGSSGPPGALLTWEGGALSFPSAALRKLLLRGEQYIPRNMIATKGVIKFDNLILTMSRFRSGNPSSLVSFDMKSKTYEPRFTPFPDMTAHEENNCEAIQNSVDIYLDPHGLLWVLDTGIVDNLNTSTVLCPPKIVCISIATKKIIKTLDLSALAVDNSRLQYIIADYDSEGKVIIYVSDAPNRAILVYDVDRAKGFRVLLPNAVAPTLKNCDVLYMTMIRKHGGQSTLYITYLYASNIFSIRTDYLRSGQAQGKITDIGSKSAPMIILGTNQQTKIYFRYTNDAVIYAWDTTQQFDPESMVSVYKSDDCFLPTSVIVDGRKSLKVLESNFQDYLSNKVGIGAIQQLAEIKNN